MEFKNILILHPGGLGDVVLSLPTLRVLRQRFPEATFTLAGNRSFLEILNFSQNIWSLDGKDIALLFTCDPHQRKDIQKFFSPFNLVISWMGGAGGVVEENLKAVGVKKILVATPIQKMRKRIKTREGESFNTTHASQAYLNTLIPLGIDERVRGCSLYLKHEDLISGDFELKNRKIPFREKPFAVIHIGSGGVKKRWPLQQFSKIVFWLQKNLNLPSLFLTGPAEEDLVDHLYKDIQTSPENHFHNLPLKVVGAIIKRSCFYLGCDSGVSHLAAALGVPTYVIFGPTHPKEWAPIGEKVIIIGPRKNGYPVSKSGIGGVNNFWPSSDNVQTAIASGFWE
ncbi:MAG TPA: glycosyltransferase family 9 protein [Nitrospiria bacterium]